MNLKEKAVNAYNEELKMKEEVFLFREKMKECFDVSVEEESKSITLENLKFSLSKGMDHLLVQKICDKCGTIDTSSYPVNSLIDLGKFVKEEGETFKHTCAPSSMDIPKERPMKQQKHQKEKEEGEWNCPFCNTPIGQKAHVCPSCGYRK